MKKFFKIISLTLLLNLFIAPSTKVFAYGIYAEPEYVDRIEDYVRNTKGAYEIDTTFNNYKEVTPNIDSDSYIFEVYKDFFEKTDLSPKDARYKGETITYSPYKAEKEFMDENKEKVENLDYEWHSPEKDFPQKPKVDIYSRLASTTSYYSRNKTYGADYLDAADFKYSPYNGVIKTDGSISFDVQPTFSIKDNVLTFSNGFSGDVCTVRDLAKMFKLLKIGDDHCGFAHDMLKMKNGKEICLGSGITAQNLSTILYTSLSNLPDNYDNYVIFFKKLYVKENFYVPYILKTRNNTVISDDFACLSSKNTLRYENEKDSQYFRSQSYENILDRNSLVLKNGKVLGINEECPDLYSSERGATYAPKNTMLSLYHFYQIDSRSDSTDIPYDGFYYCGQGWIKNIRDNSYYKDNFPNKESLEACFHYSTDRGYESLINYPND